MDIVEFEQTGVVVLKLEALGNVEILPKDKCKQIFHKHLCSKWKQLKIYWNDFV